MAIVRFTANIQRHVPCPSQPVEARTVREALDAYFESNDEARGYVVDDQGALRKHMNVFVDGRLIHDRESLSDAVQSQSTIDVMQALSGG